MSGNREKHNRHQENRAILDGRQGEYWYKKGHPRGAPKFRTEKQPVVRSEVVLLTPEEVLFNERLLDEKPASPSDIIPSVRAVGKTKVTLFKYEVPIRRSYVDPNLADIIEDEWMHSVSECSTQGDIFPQDDTAQ